MVGTHECQVSSDDVAGRGSLYLQQGDLTIPVITLVVELRSRPE
jgi:hypothetical protein